MPAEFMLIESMPAEFVFIEFMPGDVFFTDVCSLTFILNPE